VTSKQNHPGSFRWKGSVAAAHPKPVKPNVRMSGPKFGDVHGVGVAVGPQAVKLMDPVGVPLLKFPITRAVSVSWPPAKMVLMPGHVMRKGVVLVEGEGSLLLHESPWLPRALGNVGVDVGDSKA
jgi:hypothetical protein